jgi:GT2 family glycosyltransferase
LQVNSTGALDLSIIIVNYNVEQFLAQCLHSVQRAVAALEARGGQAEVFVVDNRSVDGSCAMVRRDFPWVKLEALEENLGFAKANNRAIRTSTGRHVLLLNPDTLVREDTFWRTLEYADSQPRLGGLGVPMFDGAGRYLPESKRGRPTPAASFWKITGLYRLSPRSERMNRYYLGHLPADRTAPIEVLSGAFMWMRREALDEVGLLDERYFMYGEDIDLSVRIADGGWENHYFADTSIVHYKGESTKKGSLNYVLVFYKAMLIYAEQHLAGRQAWLFHQLISLAIYLRAGLAVLARVAHNSGVQVLEFLLISAGLSALLAGYSQVSAIVYDWSTTLPLMAIYAAVWVGLTVWSGGYDRPWHRAAMARGVLLGTLVLLAVYALLPNSLRFSRALLLLGSAWAFLVTQGLRTVLFPGSFVRRKVSKRLIVASPSEREAILSMLRELLGPDAGDAQAVGLYPSDSEGDAEGYVGRAADLAEAARVHQIQEVIFSGRELSADRIMDLMADAASVEAKFRIAYPHDSHLIGAGGPVSDPLTDLARSMNRRGARRAKRSLDLGLSLLMIMGWPILAASGRWTWGRVAFSVLSGRRTWVGYAGSPEGLPALKPSVFPRTFSKDLRVVRRMDLAYARDYRVRTDLMVVREALILQRAIHRHGNN